MALCAAATGAELARAVTACGAPQAEDLRAPEIGLVMATGRIGGDGRPFNLGEVSVTRAAVRLADGRTGFAYHLGRDHRRARDAAILDALWQGEAERRPVEAALAPVAQRRATKAAAEARRTAATRVDFLTLARGED
ncbi:MAG: phosphonate C-P lyase system protein PhnG [Actinomycetospora chiangmaiensis]|nr:phosphonate C-P lyase system protein PhnG [Actinomycetospora chiangmaiensis]